MNDPGWQLDPHIKDVLWETLKFFWWLWCLWCGLLVAAAPFVVMSRLKKIEALLERISHSLDRAEDRATTRPGRSQGGENPFQ